MVVRMKQQFGQDRLGFIDDLQNARLDFSDGINQRGDMGRLEADAEEGP